MMKPTKQLSRPMFHDPINVMVSDEWIHEQIRRLLKNIYELQQLIPAPKYLTSEIDFALMEILHEVKNSLGAELAERSKTDPQLFEIAVVRAQEALVGEAVYIASMEAKPSVFELQNKISNLELALETKKEQNKHLRHQLEAIRKLTGKELDDDDS